METQYCERVSSLVKVRQAHSTTRFSSALYRAAFPHLNLRNTGRLPTPVNWNNSGHPYSTNLALSHMTTHNMLQATYLKSNIGRNRRE